METHANPMNDSSKLQQLGGRWVLGQSVLMVAVLLGTGLWHGQWTDEFSRWLAVPIGLIGAVFGVAGVVVLGRNRTIFPEPTAKSSLITHGIYRHVRHPLYTSVMLLSFGWSLWFRSYPALGVSVCLTLFLVLKSRDEEQRLRRRFNDYREYQQRTKRFLPWFW